MSTISPVEPRQAQATTVEPGRNGTPARDLAAAAEPAPTGERRGGGVAAWLAALRLTTGFIFLWAFLDKTFGLAYATQSENAWINGGSPTEGFLGGVAVGPLESTFHDWAGAAWADWLFMLGLLGIGVAVMAGVGLRIAAVSGTLMMALMWAAEWPLARHTSAGELSMSNNPLVDYHVIYAVALIVVAVTHAGDRFGFGRIWARLPFVQRYSKVLQ
jgi:thiosulfate dehydrogenase (quinone) large subunit